MLDIFKLTNDGFGVHTFELKILHLTKDDTEKLKAKLKKGRRTYDDNSKVLRRIMEKRSGLRIYLNFNQNGPAFLSVTVNPTLLMNENAEMTQIMNMGDIKYLYTMLDYELKAVLGDNFPLSRFRLVRIDCCVNFIAENSSYVTDYINLLRRSMLIHSGRIIRCVGIHADRAFTVKYSHFTFTAYDKYCQLADTFPRYEDMILRPEGLIRFELQYGNRVTNEAYKKLNTTDPIKVVGYFTENSERFFKDFIRHHFLSGDFFVYHRAIGMIDSKKITPKIALRMKNYLASCDNGMTTGENLRAAGHKRRKTENMLSAFADIGIYPINIRMNELSGRHIFPGLCTIFNIAE